MTYMRDHADMVLLATVNTITTRSEAAGKMVWTDYHCRVEEVLLDASEASVGDRTIISFAGGQYNSLDVGILGVPQLEAGQRYVLFLLPRDPYPSATIGWGQGIFQMVDLPIDTGRRPVLMSYDHQPLELDANGALFRGSPIVVSAQGWQALSTRREDVDSSPKAAEPLIVDAAGQPIRQDLTSPQPSAVSMVNRRFADLNHLRRFLRGELQESFSYER